MNRLLLLAGLVWLTCACGSAQAGIRGDPAHYLLGLDQLASPDFTVSLAPQAEAKTSFAGNDKALGEALNSLQFQAAAHEEFLRQNADLRFTNGPVQILDSIAAFDGTLHAASAYAIAVRDRSQLPGVTSISTGGIGDESHATTLVVSKNGLQLIEVAVEWRVENLVNVLIIRGREGGARLDDALLLAQRQTSNELAGTTPTA